MRVNRLLGAVTAATVALAPVAASATQTVGSLVTVKGDAYVAREGRLLRAQPSMAVNAGDRVITRNGAVADVSLGSCSVSVAGGEMKTFAGDSCGSVQSASFTRAADSSSHGSQLLGGGSVFIIAILAVGAIVLGVVAATTGSSRPTSP